MKKKIKQESSLSQTGQKSCSNRIICIGLVDGCISEAIKKCIEVENTNTKPTQKSHPEAAKLTIEIENNEGCRKAKIRIFRGNG